MAELVWSIARLRTGSFADGSLIDPSVSTSPAIELLRTYHLLRYQLPVVYSTS